LASPTCFGYPWAKSTDLHRIIGAMAVFDSTYKAQEHAQE